MRVLIAGRRWRWWRRRKSLRQRTKPYTLYR